MRYLGIGHRLRVGLVTVVLVVVGLVSTTSGVAAPRDTFLNLRQCLRGGWHVVHTGSGRSFHGPLGCIFYVLRGGTFETVTPVPQPEETPPTPPAATPPPVEVTPPAAEPTPPPAE